eukprot:gene34353-biopygen26626
MSTFQATYSGVLNQFLQLKVVDVQTETLPTRESYPTRIELSHERSITDLCAKFSIDTDKQAPRSPMTEGLSLPISPPDAIDSDLVNFLRSVGFKPNVGLYTFDNDDADTNFTTFLYGLTHVLFPISYSEASKLLDLDHDHEFYHVAINELLFCILPHVLRGNAPYIYHECARVHPDDGRYALQRLRYEVEGIPDADDMRFWTKMRATRIDETKDPAPQLDL